MPNNYKWLPFSAAPQLANVINGKEFGPRIARGAAGTASDEMIDGEVEAVVSFIEEGYRLSLEVSNTLPTGGLIPGLHPDDVVSARRALARLDTALCLRGYQDWMTKLINQDQREAVEGALSLRDDDLRVSDGRAGDPIITAALQFDETTTRLSDLYAVLGRALEEYKADKDHPNYAWLQQNREATLEALIILAAANASPSDLVQFHQRLARGLDRNAAIERELGKAAAALQSKNAAERELGRAHDALHKLATAG